MLNRIREAKKNEKGFTLIELLIVIVILGILAAIVVFSVAGIQDKGKASACKADVKTVAVAEEALYAQTNAYAATTAALKAAGLLHTEPPAGEVSITVNAGPPASVTVVGAVGSDCAGFAG